MLDLPLVTVITPSFNQVDYLEQSMRSVLEQGYPNLEYFVMDGGSTDGSVELIEKYAPRLAGWVSEPDRGQADGVNKGLARAQGEIIGWLNSDDLYLPGAILGAVQTFQANPQAGMVFSDVQAIDAAGRVTNVMRYGNWGLEDLMTFHIIGQPGVFIRRRVLEGVGMLDLRYRFLLDHQLWLRLAQVAPMVHVRAVWAAGRFHPAAKNVAQAPRFGSEAYAIVDWMRTQPALAEPFSRLEKRIQAGAHRMNARYLLDGGLARESLRSYRLSFRAHAPTALSEAHRMAYAGLSLVGLGGVKPLYFKLRQWIRRT
jgi:glycosyltransferase involved in cell wall biosynthesis